MIDQLLQRLTAAFDQEVAFYHYPPSTLTAPSVIVHPGSPFLEPSTHGLIAERWAVSIVVRPFGPERGVTQMRDFSLKVRQASSSVGALWVRTAGPVGVGGQEGQPAYVQVSNEIQFRYDPIQQLGE